MSHATSEAIWRWERGRRRHPDALVRSARSIAKRPRPSRPRRAGGSPGRGSKHDVRVAALVIRSAKPAGFCAGVDLKTILSLQTPAEVEAFVRRGLAVFDHLSALPVPTLAVIHGACLGGGLELALACRRRVALASAAPLQVGMPEVHLGLIPAWGAISQLPRLMGPDDGLNLLITGRSIGYLLARSHGIVDRLAAEGDLDRIARPARVRSRDRTDLAQRSLGRGLEPRARTDRRAAGRVPRGPASDPHDRRDRPRPRPRGRPRSHRQSPGRAGRVGRRPRLR